MLQKWGNNAQQSRIYSMDDSGRRMQMSIDAGLVDFVRECLYIGVCVYTYSN